MTFEQVKKIITENSKFINEVSSDHAENYFYDFLMDAIYCIEEDKNIEDREKFFKTFDEAVLHFTDVVIKSKTTKEDKVILASIADLLYNVSLKYEYKKRDTEVSALCMLAEESRSLEDIVFILMFLFNKISSRLYEEPTSSYISRKYYEELSNYLSNRGSHSDKYDL